MAEQRVGKLNKHFAALGAASVAVIGVSLQNANAAFVHSGEINLNVPSTTAGIYLNILTGISATTPAGAPGWDINPWGSTAFNIWTNNAANPANSDGMVVNFAGGASATLIDNLPPSTPVGPAFTFGRTGGTETTGGAAFILNSNFNFAGFRFFNESTNAINYGWARFDLGATAGGQPRTLIHYLYDNSGNPVPVTDFIFPEPTSLGLLAAGAAGLALRRRNG